MTLGLLSTLESWRFEPLALRSDGYVAVQSAWNKSKVISTNSVVSLCIFFNWRQGYYSCRCGTFPDRLSISRKFEDLPQEPGTHSARLPARQRLTSLSARARREVLVVARVPKEKSISVSQGSQWANGKDSARITLIYNWALRDNAISSDY